MRILAVSESEFAALRGDWQDLLRRSDADPLFMSWDWQWLWWKHHRAPLQAQLRLFAVRSDTGLLIALIPLYEHRARLRGLPIRRLELIGHAWRDERAFYSEYLDFVIDRSVVDSVLPELCNHVCALRWDEFVVVGALADSHVAKGVARWLRSFTSIREGDASVAHRVSLEAGFDAFVRGLPQSVRRRLLNHRARLVQPEFLRADEADIGPLLDTLSSYKRSRWGARYADAPAIRAFEVDLARQLHASGHLELTRLTSGGKVLAVMFNARIGATEYYLQSAFDPERSRGLSLGYLHFGYAIEAAVRGSVTQFDLLAGEGLSTDYKRELGSRAVSLSSYQAIRSPWLRAAYSAYDYWYAIRAPRQADFGDAI